MCGAKYSFRIRQNIICMNPHCQVGLVQYAISQLGQLAGLIGRVVIMLLLEHNNRIM